MENGNRAAPKDSQRENELGQIIEGIYKLFEQINFSLKKLLDPQNKNNIAK